MLIANAGVGHFDSIENLSEAEWKETIDTNLTGVFHSVKASLPALKQSRGYIITIASLAGANFLKTGLLIMPVSSDLLGLPRRSCLICVSMG